ncbi:MAG: ADP-forming succinate--CoA ligase subunit beta [Candidatus Nezhaarchaeota archaeon]|nr:ADP-forming succinate--CoA ligase subunit beta [Candidatus Nezhaarchaeota archaeon]MCX8141294.1 ADP-forming succinate--CoA ligase subunit beta [Candidatus Nezhaarchaeota archaeon]MDW8049560.1 ADP-forming succinate--CoA ligase subunit beta [Nitrososphaerota archaeon]
MRILEYEAKSILTKYGVPIPRGGLAKSAREAREIAQKLNAPYVVKAQVPVVGRGRLSGVLFAESVEDVERISNELFKMTIGGFPVTKVLVEEKVNVLREIYFGMTIDRIKRTYIIVASTRGGADVEEVIREYPHETIKFWIDPLHGFQFYQAKNIIRRMGYRGDSLISLANILHSLYRAGMDLDAELIEINPLAETQDGKFLALDARIVIDDNALFRHPEYRDRSLEDKQSLLEIEATKYGLAYVKLDGDIGIIGNGAGLTMATIDLVKLYGGRPANFLDVGGGASAERMAIATRMVLSDPRVKALFINILGGITQCDEIARGIVKALKDLNIEKPIVVRLLGTNEEEGKRILMEMGIHVFDSMEEAAKHIVKLVEGGNGDNS